MRYYFSKESELSYDAAVAKVTEELKREGFGVLTEIDVRETLKKKINVDFRKYRILGACNPSYAHQALTAEPLIGTMLPCNVVVQVKANGRTEISAINPLSNMRAIGNPALDEIARQIAGKLEAVIARV